MIIKKEYKIKAMCEELKASIEEACNKNNNFCEMGILFLRDILEVLEEVEAKTEEKELVFAELEGGTKTSGYYSTEEAGKALKKVIEEVNKKSCFGNYQDVYMCRNCDQIKECIKKLFEKQDNTCVILCNEEDARCKLCDEYDNCLKAGRENEQKKH